MNKMPLRGNDSGSEIIIVGGGIIGLTAAIGIRLRGYDVRIVDAKALDIDRNPILDARVYALNHASETCLHNLGVWQALNPSRLSPYRHMHVWDGMNGAELEFDINQTGQERLGTIIEESVLKQGLLERALEVGVDMYPHFEVQRVETTSTQIQVCSQQQTLCAKLLIVADGALSPTRAMLGVKLTEWSYHQEAIVALVEHSQSHQQTAYQVFNSDGPLAFLPLVDPNCSSIVWSTSSRRATDLLHRDDNDFSAQLTKAFASKLGASRVVSPRSAYPLSMRHVQQYYGPRWALLGDAAHTIHPLAGLGLNVGFADVVAMLETMDRIGDQLSDAAITSRALQAYQRQRKTALWQTIALMEGIKMLFATPFVPVKLLRGFGMRALNQCLPVKRLFIDYASQINDKPSPL